MSNFVKYDLGFLDAGSVVEVAVDTRVVVRLMDAANFNVYRSATGGRYEFFGGEAIRSPIPIEVPRSGHWFVAIDFNGGSGQVRSSVNVLSPV